MALSSGAHIGPYTVGEEIGSGGMGVVYRATDTNLKRDVAIKALPESLAADVERLARFQREAEVLASLNHANIAQIYGLEKANGATALIMELVDGETLADRIAKGPLPPDEALGIAMQIADALETAHSQNIVHRDLKPANVKLRPDGTVKVLDFGIAKALEPESLRTEPQSPMLTTPATQVGVILGTAAYMSPEQAKGKAVDQRTDIWSFGCVLYEMFTGQMAFGAEDVPSTLARVIERDPDMDSLASSISSAVRQTIRLCLQKDVRKRVADVRDVRLALDGAFDVDPRDAMPTGLADSPSWVRALPVAVAAVLLTGLLSWALFSASENTPEPQPVVRLSVIHPGEDVIGGGVFNNNVAIAPNGTHVAYLISSQPGVIGMPLYVRALDQLEPILLADSARTPFFSWDGQWVGFVDGDGQMSRVALTGGPVLPIGGRPGFPRGAVWSSDDVIIFATSEQTTGLLRIPVAGGEVEELTTPDRANGEIDHLFPDLLPGERHVLFTISNDQGGRRAFGAATANSSQVALLDLETRAYRILISGGSHARYSPSGHIVYGMEGTLRAVPFDLARLEVIGTPVPVLQGVWTNDIGFANYGLAANGTLVYLPGGHANQGTLPLKTLHWIDRDGREEPVALPAGSYDRPRLSPDGAFVAYGGQDVWVADLARGTPIRVTSEPGVDLTPLWTPDGESLVFASWREGTGLGSFYRKPADGTGRAEKLLTSEQEGSFVPHAWSQDGDLVFAYGLPNGGGDIGMWPLGSDQELQPLVASPDHETAPTLSPDGSWIAYTSDETGRCEVYVERYPERGARSRISTKGGGEASWSADGRTLFYREATRMISVSIDDEQRFGTPEPIFGGLGNHSCVDREYDISPVDERFLVVKQTGSDTGINPVVVLNWSDELTRLAPVADQRE